MKQIPNRRATGAHVGERPLAPEVQEAWELLSALGHGAASIWTGPSRAEQPGLPEGVREARAQLERLKARFAAPTALTTQRESAPGDADA